ncbi:hypothetical protein [Rhodoglobus aureus]
MRPFLSGVLGVSRVCVATSLAMAGVNEPQPQRSVVEAAIIALFG